MLPHVQKHQDEIAAAEVSPQELHLKVANKLMQPVTCVSTSAGGVD